MLAPKKAVAAVFAIVSIVMLVKKADSYEVETHAAMSSAAANQAPSLPAALQRIGLRPLRIDDRRQLFINSEGTALSIVELIQFGARWEDEASDLQALRHFYDPVNDRALDLGGTAASLIARSPDWALEDLGDVPIQAFSYREARTYLYKALTEPSGLDRKKYFGLTFQTLGHVIHHLQDMAQPQHVRNDPHCDAKLCKVAAALNANPLLYAPSMYEKYTELDLANDPRNQIRRNLPYLGQGSEPVYPGTNAAQNPFKKPRLFWRTTDPKSDISAGQGIAEFTNRNFFSAETVANPYSSPHPPAFSDWYAPSDVADIQTLLTGTSLRGTVHFFGRPVNDSLIEKTSENKRAVSDSLFDGDLAQIYSSTRTTGPFVFALNRFTYDAAHQFLIPRAVGYSAGLINYFFRGELDVRVADEGVYGVIDHVIGNLADVDGFQKIKLKLKNVTPGGTDENGRPIVEPIADGSTGSVVAVVRFHRNRCYQPDLSGEYGAPGIDWSTCRSAAEEIVVSQPQSIPSGINTDFVTMTFTFGSPIPINATDLYLQVVYRGPLGYEPDAVIVATKDISEPNYFYTFNTSDQYLYCANGVISSEPPCAQLFTFAQSFCEQAHPELSYAQCAARYGSANKFRQNATAAPLPGYDPTQPAYPQGEDFAISLEPPFEPVFTVPAPVGTFARVAFLTDASPSEPYVLVRESGVGDMAVLFRWVQGTFVPAINQLDVESNTMTTNRRYAKARGVYVSSIRGSYPLSDADLLATGNAPDIPTLTLAPSQINF